jgi:hypothetical protein
LAIKCFVVKLLKLSRCWTFILDRIYRIFRIPLNPV